MVASLALLFFIICALPVSALEPGEVIVVYNGNVPESRELALHYSRARGLGSAQLVGLDLPNTQDISRAEFQKRLREPLQKRFTVNGWWKMPSIKDKNRPVALKSTKIKAMVLMRGVPVRVKRSKDRVQTPPGVKQFKGVTEASVDTELSTLGIWNSTLTGPLPNPYFKKDEAFKQSSLEWGPIMVTRIDGPSYAICRGMIDDAVEVEKSGLWGKAYVDLSKKYKQGDDWLKAATETCDDKGIVCIQDIYKDTFTSHYPMNDCALYLGWYTTNRNGPLLNPAFRFKKGAVAIHIHSFSAARLRDGDTKWCGPILSKGAAATVGNVYEPYLALTHHLDILLDRLLKGYSWAEASHMAQPSLSWQTIVLGDPLYRPFKHFEKVGGETLRGDKIHRAYRLAHMEWAGDPVLLTSKVRTAASRMNSGTLYEALGQKLLRDNEIEQAAAFFQSARDSYLVASDKLRQELHLIDILRRLNKKSEALRDIESASRRFQSIPENRSLIGLKNILAPPPPKPKKNPEKPKTRSPGGKP